MEQRLTCRNWQAHFQETNCVVHPKNKNVKFAIAQLEVFPGTKTFYASLPIICENLIISMYQELSQLSSNITNKSRIPLLHLLSFEIMGVYRMYCIKVEVNHFRIDPLAL